MKKLLSLWLFVVILLSSMGNSILYATSLGYAEDHTTSSDRVFTTADLEGHNIPDYVDDEENRPMPIFEKAVLSESQNGTRSTGTEYFIAFTSDGRVLGNTSTGTALTRLSYSNSSSSTAHKYYTWLFVHQGDDTYITGDYVIYVNYDQTRCLTADPVTKTISVAPYTGSSNQLWSMAISSSGNALRSESTDTRISGYKMYYTSSTFTLSNTNFSAVGFYQFASFVPPTDLSYDSFYLAPEQSKLVYPVKTPSNASGSNNWYDWAILDSDTYAPSEESESIATVADTGRVTAISEGTVILRFRHKITQMSGSCYLYVTAVPSGTYFVENRTYERFMQVDDDEAPDYDTEEAIMEQFPFDGGDYQKWTLTHLNNGFYKILSVSGLALSVDPDDVHSRTGTIYQLPYTGATTQQWQITTTRNGSYKIKARSSIGYETYDLVLDVQAQGSSSANGLNMQQRDYVDNSSYKDEWYLHRIHDASLMAIMDHTHITPHNDYFESVHASLLDLGYVTIEEYYDDVVPFDGVDLKVQLCSSSVLTLMAHGAPLKVVMSDQDEVTYIDIMEMSPNCLSDLELVVLASCYTGMGYPNSNPPQNFAESLAAQGAQNVVAFKYYVACDQVIPWMETFFSSLADGNSYEEAFSDADREVEENGVLFIDPKTKEGIYTTSSKYRVFITNDS